MQQLWYKRAKRSPSSHWVPVFKIYISFTIDSYKWVKHCWRTMSLLSWDVTQSLHNLKKNDCELVCRLRKKQEKTNGFYSQDASQKDIHPGWQDPLRSQTTGHNDDECLLSHGDCLPPPTRLLINMRWIIKSLPTVFSGLWSIVSPINIQLPRPVLITWAQGQWSL